MPGLVGNIWIEDSVAEVMVSVVPPDFAPNVAVTVVEPAATEVAKPLESIVAMPESKELQTTDPVRFWLVPSE